MTIQFMEIPLSQIQLDGRNPRDNAKAVEAVKESIQSYGFLVPLVVGKDNLLAAGHTRYEAARQLGMETAPAIMAEHLTEEQLRAFRLVDNKVAELAGWDFDLLADEVSYLVAQGIDLVPYGWSQQELDCLSDMVAGDCLDRASFGDGEIDPHNAGDRDWGSSTRTEE